MPRGISKRQLEHSLSRKLQHLRINLRIAHEKQQPIIDCRTHPQTCSNISKSKKNYNGSLENRLNCQSKRLICFSIPNHVFSILPLAFGLLVFQVYCIVKLDISFCFCAIRPWNFFKLSPDFLFPRFLAFPPANPITLHSIRIHNNKANSFHPHNF